MSPSRFRPLRLTWHLSSPIATSGDPIHLDALVAFAVTEAALSKVGHSTEGGPDAPAPTECVRDLAKTLPLGRSERDGHAVWQASALQAVSPDGISQGMRFWTRKTDPYEIADRYEAGQLETAVKFPLKPYALAIDASRGTFKQQFKHYPVKHIAAVQAWCIGDIDALQSLLDPAWGGHLRHIGARGRSGHGRIRAFEIVEDESAVDRWQERVLPWPHEGAVQTLLATQPPYWDVANRVTAYLRPELIL